MLTLDDKSNRKYLCVTCFYYVEKNRLADLRMNCQARET